MSKNLLSRWPEWRDDLVLALRMKDVPGKEIGEILAETEAHLDETGETPEEAFGDPKDYARQRALPVMTRTPRRERWSKFAGIGIVSFAGGAMAANAAWALGAGEMWWGPVPVLLALLIGGAVLVGLPWLVEGDLIEDPRTGENAYGDGRRPMLVLSGGLLVMLAIVFVMSLVLS